VCQYIFSGRIVCVRHASYILSALPLILSYRRKNVKRHFQGLCVLLPILLYSILPAVFGVGENVSSKDFCLLPSNTSRAFHFKNTFFFVSGSILYFLVCGFFNTKLHHSLLTVLLTHHSRDTLDTPVFYQVSLD
jgi:hypothetical protein